MTLVELARKLRPYIEKAAKSLDDSDAVDAVELFPEWDGNGAEYEINDRVRYGGILYRVLMPHTSQTTWNPADAPSLFVRVLIPDSDVIPEWVQPDSTNPYSAGDNVTHNGKTWESRIDGNVWEPGVYGWVEVA